jgi:hypothetical protein
MVYSTTPAPVSVNEDIKILTLLPDAGPVELTPMDIVGITVYVCVSVPFLVSSLAKLTLLLSIIIPALLLKDVETGNRVTG